VPPTPASVVLPGRSRSTVVMRQAGYPSVQVTNTFKARDRTAWRGWLEQHHATAEAIWLLRDDRPDEATVSYLDAVEEAICFGWIDGIEKRCALNERAQRFTPRKPRSHWTELNKERARRLIRLGLMTDAGRATLPDLDAPFAVAPDIVRALEAEPGAWSNFKGFPALYRRVRIGYIEEMRTNPSEFERRMRHFLKRTSANQTFGNWNDGGRLGCALGERPPASGDRRSESDHR
jgi:uncharacterized protein YdeI (YjbR/CyaY-like superfamily)